MRHTQDELNIIHAAQKIVAEKGHYLFVYSDHITMDAKQFTETFNPEDCSIEKPWSDCRVETEVNGLCIGSNLERDEIEDWIRRWEG